MHECSHCFLVCLFDMTECRWLTRTFSRKAEWGNLLNIFHVHAFTRLTFFCHMQNKKDGHPIIAHRSKLWTIPPRTKVGKKTLGGKRSWEGKTKLYTHNFVSSRPPTSFLIISVARCKYSIDISRFFLTSQHVMHRVHTKHVHCNIY